MDMQKFNKAFKKAESEGATETYASSDESGELYTWQDLKDMLNKGEDLTGKLLSSTENAVDNVLNFVNRPK